MPHSRRLTRAGWLTLILVVLALLIGLVVLRDFGLDDSYITYRYARYVARGWGLVYNPGETVLSTTAPLYALLLAALSFLPLDLPTLGGLVGALSIGLGGGLLADLLPRRVSFGIRAWAGLIYVLASPLWLALGMETALWLLLVLAAAWLMRDSARDSRWAWAGLLIGLAVLTRPDAVLPGALLGLGALGAAVNRRGTCARPWRGLWTFALAAALPVLLFYGWVWLAYGSPLPATFAAKRAQAALGITGLGVGVDTVGGLGLIAQSLWRQSPLYGLWIALAALGLAGIRRLPAVTLWAAAWGILHLLAYVILDVAPYRWYYAPLLPGLILLAALGLDAIRRLPRGRWLAVGSALLVIGAGVTSLAAITGRMNVDGPLTPADADPMLPVVDWRVYREAGEWINQNTPPDALIGVAEVGQVGFYADRPMTDYLGLLQPRVAAWLARGDVTSWLPATAPDYLVLQRFRGRPLVIYNYYLEPDPWFQFNYAPVVEFDDPRYAYGPVTIYRRVTALRPAADFNPRDLGFDYGPLTLDGYALDWRDLNPAERALRVGLRWSLSEDEPLPDRVRIAVAVADVDGVQGSDLTHDTARWGETLTTWHGIILPEDLPPGGYALLVTVGPAEGDPYASRPVVPLDFSFPQVDVSTVDELAGAPTFAENDAALIHLLDSAITVNNGAITLDLTWVAARDIPRVYTYFLHLRPAGESAPVRQADGQPRAEGRYPTDWWQAGEAVPDTLTLEAGDLPPGDYELVIGWYLAPDGPRLTLAGGGGALLLARVAVDAEGGVTVEPEP